MNDEIGSVGAGRRDASAARSMSCRLSEGCRRIQGQALRFLADDASATASSTHQERQDALAETCLAAIRVISGTGQAILLFSPEKPLRDAGNSQSGDAVLGQAGAAGEAGQAGAAGHPAWQLLGDGDEHMKALAGQVFANGQAAVLAVPPIVSAPILLGGRVAGSMAAGADGLPDSEAEEQVAALAELGAAFAGAWQALQSRHQLAESHRQALQALERASQADENRTQFLGVLSHELRNPATALIMGLSLLDIVAPDSAQGLRAREIMRNQTMLLVHLLDELQDITRLARRSLALNRETVDLAHIAQGTVLEIQDIFNERDVQLQVQLPEDPVRISGDAARLADMMRHLLDNALKASQKGGTVMFRMQSDAVGRDVTIDVQDHGRGIAAEDLPLLFQPFALSDHRFDRIRNGLGVGLAIVRGVAELHGGRVEVFSDGLGKGARFSVRLPLRPELPA